MTALVLGGGSTRGAVQIGMLQVLAEHGFVPDRIYGSSVGAINGVGFAADPTREGVERMTQIWLRIRREDIYPQGRLHGPWLYFQQRDAVYANSGLRAIVEEGFPHERLEDAVDPGRGGGHVAGRRRRAVVHLRAGGRRRAGLVGHAGHLPAGRDRRREVHRRRRRRQRPDPAGHRRRRHPDRRPPVLAAGLPAAGIPTTGRGHGQRPLHRHPRPVRPRHGPPARGGRGDPVRGSRRAPPGTSTTSRRPST